METPKYKIIMSDIKPSEYFITEPQNEDGYVNIQLKISKDVDREKVVSELMESLSKSTDLIKGASVWQIYFHGHDINKSLENFKNTLKENVNNLIDNTGF